MRVLKDQLSSGGGVSKVGVVSSVPYGLSYGSTVSIKLSKVIQFLPCYNYYLLHGTCR